MPPDDILNAPEIPNDTTHPSGDVPLTDGATSEAESLIRILKGIVGDVPAPAGATVPTGNGLPRIPGYELECELGHGGMGVVYKARHAGLNRVVALKMIHTTETPSPGEIARFRDEAAAVAAVRHPNVVQVFEMCPTECARPYFTMEYVEGGSLARLLKANDNRARDGAAELIADVADGLQAAHDEGIVHRDIKPANILLGGVESRDAEDKSSRRNDTAPLRLADLQPKVSDFGLAKRLAFDLTRTQGMKGTPAYMAPEQASGRAFVGPGADVYALGAVLFECLTGRPPFEGDDPLAIIHDVINRSAPSPREFNPAVPRDLELICLKCLEKEPACRYPTASALAADLRNFAAGKPVSVRPIGAVSRAARWVKRRPAHAALVLVLAGLLFVGPPLVAWTVGQIRTIAAREREAQALAEAANARERLAQEARDTAVRLARVQKLFALQNGLRTRAANRAPSWASANRADLSEAVVLAAGEPHAMRELRSAGAGALLAADLKPLEPIQTGFTASAIATDPNSGSVAIGEYLTWAPLSARVRLIDPVKGHTERTFTFTAGLGGAPDSIRALAFSPDGTRLFVGTRSSQVIRFDLNRPGNKEAARWTASKSTVEQLAVSPDGKTVYGLCRPDAPVFAWDAENGKLITKLESAAPITAFAMLGSGEVVTCDERELRRWTTAHEPSVTVANDHVARLAVTPSGTLLAGDRCDLDVYDPVELVRLDRFDTTELRRGVHEENVRTIAVHPSGAFVATSSGDTDRTLRVWEVASCRLVGTVAVKGTGPITVAWSCNGQTLLATGSGHVARWSFQTPVAQRFACLSAAPLATTTFGFGDQAAALTEPVGPHRELLVGTPGVPAGAVRFVSLGGNGRPGLAFAPQGWLAVTAPLPGIRQWEPGTPVPAPAFVTSIAWCPRFGPGGGEQPRPLWAIVDSSEVRSFDANKKPRTNWGNWVEGKTLGIASLDALAVGRSVVAVGARSGSVHILDTEKGQPLGTVPNSGDPVLSVAVSPDDAFIVAGTQGGKVRVIRTSDRKELSALPAHPNAVTAVSINHTGTLLATGSRDRVMRLWKRVGERFEPLFAVSDLSGPVRELQFHPADDRLLVLVAQERAVRVWDIEKLKGQLGRYKLAW